MPLIQLDLIFEQSGYGWSEGYVKDGASNNLLDYWTLANTLAQKRVLVSGAQTTLKFIRLSIIGVYRDVYVVGVDYQGTVGRDSDVCHTSLTFNMHNTDFSKNSAVFCRGVWDAAITIGGLYTPPAAYVAQVNAWHAEVYAGLWGWIGTLSFVDAIITSVVQNLNGTVSVVTNTPLFTAPLQLYSTVRVSGVEGAYQLNGPHVVIPTALNAFTTKKRLAIFPYVVGGKVRFNTKGFVPCSTIGFRKVGRRPCGAPFYLTPGRQTA